MAALTDTDLAYAAGLIDGEGALSLNQRMPGVWFPQVFVKMVDGRPLTWLHEVFGGSNYPRPAGNERSRPTWCWAIVARKAISCIEQIRPYLRVKDKQADILLGWYDLEKSARTGAVETMHILNKRGI